MKFCKSADITKVEFSGEDVRLHQNKGYLEVDPNTQNGDASGDMNEENPTSKEAAI